MLIAMQKGVARGIFSNESGLGSAPIAAAAAQTKEPVRQGLVTMTGTFIDTVCICTLTGLTIMTSGAYEMSLAEGLEGVEVTSKSFRKWSALVIFGRHFRAHDSAGILRIHNYPRMGLL